MVCPACGLVHSKLTGGFGETSAFDGSGMLIRGRDRRPGCLADPRAPGARSDHGNRRADAAAEVAVQSICRGLDCPDPWDALDMLHDSASNGGKNPGEPLAIAIAAWGRALSLGDRCALI